MALCRWTRWLSILGFVLGWMPLLAQNYTVTTNNGINFGTVTTNGTAQTISMDATGVMAAYPAGWSGPAIGVPASFTATNTNTSANDLSFICFTPTTVTAMAGGISTSFWPVTPSTANLPNKGNTATFTIGVSLSIPAGLASGTYSGTFSKIVAANGKCNANQVISTPDLTVTITINSSVNPISLALNQNLAFGSVATSVAAGTVSISTVGFRSTTGGVFPIMAPTFNAGQCTVSGTASATYTITSPVGATANLTSGANTLAVDTFQTLPATPGTIGAVGSQALLIGATGRLTANQPAGDYTGSVSVVVAYTASPGIITTVSLPITIRILQPITITKLQDLEFGTIVLTSNGAGGTVAGTVTMTPGGARTPVGCTLLGTQGGPVAGSPQPATFSIVGSAAVTYGITLSSDSLTLKNTIFGDMIIIDNFQASINGGANFLISTSSTINTFAGAFPASTTRSLAVGGRLNLPITPSPGLNDGDYTAAAGATLMQVNVIYD